MADSIWEHRIKPRLYPETVDLARVLAMPRWSIPATMAEGDIQRFQHDVRSYTGIRYERAADRRYDPLFRWFQKRRGRDW